MKENAGDRLRDGPVTRDGSTGWLHRFLTPPGFHLLLCGPAAGWDPGALDRLRRGYATVVSVDGVAAEPGPGALYDARGSLLARLAPVGPTQHLVRPTGTSPSGTAARASTRCSATSPNGCRG